MYLKVYRLIGKHENNFGKWYEERIAANRLRKQG